ncbi:hypothetical protein L861_13885 [Litchfieldella anticariensis FP35 = DSM 16096]|uniref:HTH tetR-type domain-containing protein n=1 Tax=Litchfieldella anticariensis (strain DSM 16096 / CECT 5854 / CIP 108499 / LMG 22089 / FP35) TaxID=1121939 RepID=S2KES1_LITA3|nr:TetR/AcrR family transcriptional regulator [Halomonas anticariensis]EPC00360.1 hypothetical protein L861_13885 [Halomonas anticariensis FP35 = DSM 16096]
MTFDILQSPKPASRSTRDAIKYIVTEMLIRNGYRGTTMSKIANEAGTTTTNIFYHFQSKNGVIDEVVADYVEHTLKVHGAIWRDNSMTLEEKIYKVVEFNRSRYLRFNPSGESGNSWSLIARLRLETDVISTDSQHQLNYFSEALYSLVVEAIKSALANGELAEKIVPKEAAMVIAMVINSSAQFSTEKGSFKELEILVDVVSKMFFDAYGKR